MSILSYAGIGSRETPSDILDLFFILAGFLARHGFTLRSGGAPGADQVFERGCDLVGGPKQIFIPWRGFEHSTSDLIVESPAAFELASQFHPSWDRLSPGARKLHARNCHQVLGWTLDSPCDFIICYTRGGTGAGGTGQALRIAAAHNIPVFDFGAFDSPDSVKSAFNSFYQSHRH